MFKGDIIQQTPVLLHLFGARNISSSKDPKQHLTGEFLNTKNEIPWISYVKRVEKRRFFWGKQVDGGDTGERSEG